MDILKLKLFYMTIQYMTTKITKSNTFPVRNTKSKLNLFSCFVTGISVGDLNNDCPILSIFHLMHIGTLARTIMKTQERRTTKVAKIQPISQVARAERPWASCGVDSNTELNIVIKTSRLVIRRPNLKI